MSVWVKSFNQFSTHFSEPIFLKLYKFKVDENDIFIYFKGRTTSEAGPRDKKVFYVFQWNHISNETLLLKNWILFFSILFKIILTPSWSPSYVIRSTFFLLVWSAPYTMRRRGKIEWFKMNSSVLTRRVPFRDYFLYFIFISEYS